MLTMLIAKTTDKGLGLFTQDAIKAGTCIIYEKPLVIVRGPNNHLDTYSFRLELELLRLRDNSPGDYDDYMALFCWDKLLSSEDKQQVLEYHGLGSSSSPLSSSSFWLFSTSPYNRLTRSDQAELIIKHLCIFHTNAAALSPVDQFAAGQAVYHGFSRINHSCIPNIAFHPDGAGAGYDDDDDEGGGPATAERPWMTVCAVRDLAAGEELTVPYVMPGLSAARRAEALARGYGFACTCAACRGPRAAAHEAYRRRIRAIEAALTAYDDDGEAARRHSGGEEALALARRRVVLLKKTGLVGAELVAAYWDCYNYAKSLGRRSSEVASYWHASHRVYRVCSGIDGTTKSDNEEYPKVCCDGDETADDEREAVDSYTLCDTFLIFC